MVGVLSLQYQLAYFPKYNTSRARKMMHSNSNCNTIEYLQNILPYYIGVYWYRTHSCVCNQVDCPSDRSCGCCRHKNIRTYPRLTRCFISYHGKHIVVSPKNLS